MGLRTIDDREIRLREQRSGEVIATLGFDDALRDAHEGAIYHHQGRTYEVTELDLRNRVATLERTRADYFTRVRHDKDMTVEADHRERAISADVDVPVSFADVTMRKQITGFERRNARSGEVIARESLDLPETTLETSALYYTLPLEMSAELEELGDFAGGIHAAEHAMISLFPLSFLCDRRDIGGLSTPMHPHTDRPTIFIYDGYPGGVGLTEAAYDSFEQLTDRTHEMLLACDCEGGCPAGQNCRHRPAGTDARRVTPDLLAGYGQPIDRAMDSIVSRSASPAIVYISPPHSHSTTLPKGASTNTPLVPSIETVAPASKKRSPSVSLTISIWSEPSL
jgi:DEAD/DEAH box helicase domain-containing protein